MNRTTHLFRAVLGLLVVGVSAGCPPRPAVAPLDMPDAFRAEADGTVHIEDLRFNGRLRMDYLVYSNGRVAVSDLTAWIRDADVVTRFIFWETGREKLRCTKFSNVGVAEGSVAAADRLVFPSAAVELSGVSFEQRNPDRSCVGLARRVTAQNNTDVEVHHDPAADSFGLVAAFRGTYDGDAVSIRLDMSGSFLNRPPEAALGVFQPSELLGGGSTPGGVVVPPGWDHAQGGCPPLVGDNPPAAVANDPAGLRLHLVSLSVDPDRGGGRGDVARDIWSHSTGGAFRFLGDRQVTAPVLFETGLEHELVLTTVDHQRAADRMTCRFLVISAEETERMGGGA